MDTLKERDGGVWRSSGWRGRERNRRLSKWKREREGGREDAQRKKDEDTEKVALGEKGVERKRILPLKLYNRRDGGGGGVGDREEGRQRERTHI